MYHLIQSLGSLPFDIFALAGGGGSSGGGGGGGGGSYSGGGSGSGNGGDVLSLIIGFIPMYIVGTLLAKVTRDKTGAKIIVNIIGWAVAIGYMVFLINIMGFLGVFFGGAGFAGMASGLYSLATKMKHGFTAARAQLQAAASKDSAWEETKLIEYASATFLKYQQDWSKLDTNAMKAYLTPNYHYHASLLVSILVLMGRKNIVEDIVLSDAVITNISDSNDDTQDRFTIVFSGHARDQLIENDGTELFVNTSTFTEYWHFLRSGNTWLLDSVGQSTADIMSVNQGLIEVAMKHNYRYSEDMGWLFIPKRGQLFDGARFGTSDINNHIVGMYNDKLLVQVYSYVENPVASTRPYVIAQVSVPRQYGNIVVRRKKALQPAIRGLERVETEWTKFNQKYEVFASGYEQATSFELLNPTYMEQLEALPFEVNIEVVDNVVYLYTDERGTFIDTYETMLDILEKAFKEMRL